MKKPLIIVILSLLIVAIMTVNVGNKDNLKVGNVKVKEGVNTDLIEKYMSLKGEEKKKIENNIKSIILKDLELDTWLEYVDDVDVLIKHLDLIDNDKKELVVGLNLSKNLGAIGIYIQEGDSYILKNKINNLTTIRKLTAQKSRENDKRFLVVEEFLDERVGAYFTDRFIRIFTKEEEFEEVFRDSIVYESYYNEKWIDENKENPKWFKLEDKSELDYSFKEDKGIYIIVSKNITKSEGESSVNIPKEFRQVEKSEFKINYTWSDQYKKFIMGTGKIISTGEEVAILEDASKTADYLLNLGDKYYKVINKNMQIDYVKEYQLEIKDV